MMVIYSSTITATPNHPEAYTTPPDAAVSGEPEACSRASISACEGDRQWSHALRT